MKGCLIPVVCVQVSRVTLPGSLHAQSLSDGLVVENFVPVFLPVLGVAVLVGGPLILHKPSTNAIIIKILIVIIIIVIEIVIIIITTPVTPPSSLEL